MPLPHCIIGMFHGAFRFPQQYPRFGIYKGSLRSNSHIQPTALKRAGAGYHDGHLSGSLSSATAIRKHLRENSIENGRSLVNYEEILTKTMPESAALLAARRLSCESPVWEDDFSLLLRYRLMLQSPEELGTYAIYLRN